MKLLWLTTLIAVIVKSKCDEFTTHLSKESSLNGLLNDIYKERSYETLVVRASQKELYNVEFLKQLEVPKLLLNHELNFTLTGKWNNNFLILSIAETAESIHDDLDELAARLNKIRGTRIVFYIKQKSEEQIDFAIEVKTFFELCFSLNILNIIVVLQNKCTFYGYTPFPNVQVLELDKHMGQYFRHSMLNLYGHPIRTYPDQYLPRAMVYTNKKTGEMELIGYVGRLLRAFAEYHNATLQFPLPITLGQPIFFAELMKLTKNGTLDIPATFASYVLGSNMLGSSYPVEISHLCVMLPIPIVTIDDIYNIIFGWRVYVLLIVLLYSFGILVSLSNYVFWHYTTSGGSSSQRRFSHQLCFNDTVFRGIFAQSFAYPKSMLATHKLTFMLIFLSGYFTQVTFGVYLQTYLTQRPLIQSSRSFDDMLNSNIRIATHKAVIDAVQLFKGPEFMQKYESTFLEFGTYADTVKLRSAFNTSYAYCVTSSTWSVYVKQLEYFGYRSFYVTPNICIQDFDLSSFPLQLNSIYEAPLHAFILRVMESGLYQHWYDSNFQDTLKLGLLPMRDSSRSHEFHATEVEDLQQVISQFVCGLLISFAVFLGELFMNWLNTHKIVDFSDKYC